MNFELFGKIFVTVVCAMMLCGSIAYCYGGKYGTALFWFFVMAANMSFIYLVPKWG